MATKKNREGKSRIAQAKNENAVDYRQRTGKGRVLRLGRRERSKDEIRYGQSQSRGEERRDGPGGMVRGDVPLPIYHHHEIDPKTQQQENAFAEQQKTRRRAYDDLVSSREVRNSRAGREIRAKFMDEVRKSIQTGKPFWM